jgi:hypothetical protein
MAEGAKAGEKLQAEDLLLPAATEISTPLEMAFLNATS